MVQSLVMNVSVLINKKEKTSEKAVHTTVTKESNSDYVRLKKNYQFFFKVGSLSSGLKRPKMWSLFGLVDYRDAHFVLPAAKSISWSTVASFLVLTLTSCMQLSVSLICYLHRPSAARHRRLL